MLVCVCVSVLVCVCLSVCVHDNSKNNGSIHLKLERIVVYENSSEEFFSIYHNTKVLYLSFGTCLEVMIKYVC